MPRNLPKRCKDCGVDKAPGVHVSRNGLCVPCGARRMLAIHEAVGDEMTRQSLTKAP